MHYRAEVTASKRALLLHVAEKKQNEMPYYEVKDFFKRQRKNNISDRWINMLVDDLNHCGVVSFRNQPDSGRMVRFDLSKIFVRYERDKFIPDLGFFGVFAVFSLAVSLVLLSLYAFLVSVSWAAAFSGYFFLKIARTPDMKKVFIESQRPEAGKLSASR